MLKHFPAPPELMSRRTAGIASDWRLGKRLALTHVGLEVSLRTSALLVLSPMLMIVCLGAMWGLASGRLDASVYSSAKFALLVGCIPAIFLLLIRVCFPETEIVVDWQEQKVHWRHGWFWKS